MNGVEYEKKVLQVVGEALIEYSKAYGQETTDGGWNGDIRMLEKVSALLAVQPFAIVPGLQKVMHGLKLVAHPTSEYL